MYDFSVDYNIIDIILMNIKQAFIGLINVSWSLVSMVNDSYFTTSIFLYNQPCMTRATLIDLDPHEFKDCITILLWLI